MNREVELVLSGLHTAGENTGVETTQPAQYFKKNDSHYLLYEEEVEGFDGICKSRIKFRENLLERTRQGAVEMHVIVEKNKRHIIPYDTPYGRVLLGIETSKVLIEEQENQMHVTVEYTLDQEGELLSESCLKMYIRENNTISPNKK